MMWETHLIAALIILCVCVTLIFHCEYEDGLIGRIALAGISIAEFALVVDALDGSEYHIMPSTFIVQISLCVFLLRHLYRFLKWHRRGAYEWRAIQK